MAKLLPICIVFILIAGCDQSAKGKTGRLTKENYLKITESMSVQDVRLLLGPTKKTQTFPGAGYHAEWEDGKKWVAIMWDKNGRIESKQHTGLDSD